MFIYDIENLYNIRNLLLAHMLGIFFPEEQKRDNKKKKDLLCIDPQSSQNKTEEWSHWMDWEEDLWYGPANLDNRVSENTQNIQKHRKLHHEYQGKLEGGIDNRKTNLNKGKNPMRHLPKKLAFTTAFPYSFDTY